MSVPVLFAFAVMFGLMAIMLTIHNSFWMALICAGMCAFDVGWGLHKQGSSN